MMQADTIVRGVNARGEICYEARFLAESLPDIARQNEAHMLAARAAGAVRVVTDQALSEARTVIAA